VRLFLSYLVNNRKILGKEVYVYMEFIEQGLKGC
jgi:hypothetical protein